MYTYVYEGIIKALERTLRTLKPEYVYEYIYNTHTNIYIHICIYIHMNKHMNIYTHKSMKAS